MPIHKKITLTFLLCITLFSSFYVEALPFVIVINKTEKTLLVNYQTDKKIIGVHVQPGHEIKIESPVGDITIAGVINKKSGTIIIDGNNYPKNHIIKIT